MRLLNGEHGYGAVTKSLHWLTFVALASQFWVGYTMVTEDGFREADCDPPGEDRSGGDTTDAEEDRMDRLEEACEARQDRLEEESDDLVGTAWSDLGSGDLLDGGVTLPELHVLLGLSVLVLGLVRIGWRTATPLPPWDTRLTAGDRVTLSVVERVLLGLLLAVPLTGLSLVVVSDDWLALHVAAHVCFFAALAVHVAVVVRRGVVGRMLPGGQTPSWTG